MLIHRRGAAERGRSAERVSEGSFHSLLLCEVSAFCGASAVKMAYATRSITFCAPLLFLCGLYLRSRDLVLLGGTKMRRLYFCISALTVVILLWGGVMAQDSAALR